MLMAVSDIFLGLGVLCALWASLVGGMRPYETGSALAVPTVFGLGCLLTYAVLVLT
jgi:hypothetical protein